MALSKPSVIRSCSSNDSTKLQVGQHECVYPLRQGLSGLRSWAADSRSASLLVQFYNAVQLMCVPSASSVRWVQGCCLQCVEVVLCISVQL